MSIKTQDPFRFLKRIKKDVTPQKERSNKAPSVTELPMSITSIQKIQSIDQSISQSTISKLYGRGFLSRPPYDADKYYSQKSQNYLKQINFRKNPQYRQYQIMSTLIQQNNMEKTQKQLSYDEQLKTDNKKNNERNRQYKDTINQITFKKIEFQHVEGHIGDFTKENNIDLEFFEQDEQMTTEQTELKECITCHRKFNLKSYQKHIKICEKVFMKKRKPFSSEKQRSTSKEKKRN